MSDEQYGQPYPDIPVNAPPSPTASEYLGTRLDDREHWHTQESMISAQRENILRWTEMVAAGLIPIIALTGLPLGQYFVALLGAMVCVAAALRSTGRYHDLYKYHHQIAEGLKRLRHLFTYRCAPYDQDATRLQRLVEDTEQLLAVDYDQWRQQGGK